MIAAAMHLEMDLQAIVCITGEKGSGKSSLLKLLTAAYSGSATSITTAAFSTRKYDDQCKIAAQITDYDDCYCCKLFFSRHIPLKRMLLLLMLANSISRVIIIVILTSAIGAVVMVIIVVVIVIVILLMLVFTCIVVVPSALVLCCYVLLSTGLLRHPGIGTRVLAMILRTRIVSFTVVVRHGWYSEVHGTE